MSDISLFQTWQQDARQSGDDFVVALVQRVLQEAARSNVSDVHFQPHKMGKEGGLEIRFRQDGVLHSLGSLPQETIPQIAARLKVLANLLTYKTNVPQEGRVRAERLPGVNKEIRISTVPTLFGERVAVRFFAEENQFQYPEQLGFSDDILDSLLHYIEKHSGTVLITGPAGSGKTTTAYALLRQLASRGETLRSIITLEDPIEHALEGTAQVDVHLSNDAPLGDMIKYLMRQDPEVLLVGEIRDRPTAEAALQAALTGHLLISTFHAGSAADAVGRFFELGIEPYMLRSSLSCVLSQRLVRRLCECSEWASEPITLEINAKRYELDTYRSPKGCLECQGTGYRGRLLLAELLPLDNPMLLRSLIDRQDSLALQTLAMENGMVPIGARAVELIQSGVTSPQEIRRMSGGR